MTIDRAIEILDPEHREHYDGMDEVNEACRMGMEALQATSYVLAADKMEGYGCIAALYEAASKAQTVKRMAALTKLLAISAPISFMAGLANTTIV